MNFIQKIALKALNIKSGTMLGGVNIPTDYPQDFWQKGMSVPEQGDNTTVEACVSTISQTIAMLPIYHYRTDELGNDNVVTTSAASRILRKPNPYQTKSDFFLNYSRQLLLTGNGYGAVTRNRKFEIDALYPQYNLRPYISIDLKDVYYAGSDAALIKFDNVIPGRNVLHTRLHSDGKNPLMGITPLTAAMIAASTGTSIQGHENKFFQNMSRPSGVVTTDMTLTADQTKELRTRFNEQTKDLNTGGIPILTNGLKFDSMSMSAVDAEIIETYKMTKNDIASVFRVPMPLIGGMDSATYDNVEALMKFWISSGLGFILDHIEQSLNDLFNLPPGEFINFDTDYLLRSDFKDRMDGLAKGVQGGIYTPNEARAKEGLGKKEHGDKIYLQAQMVQVGTTMDGTIQGEQTDDEEDVDMVDADMDNEGAKQLIERLSK